MKFSHLFAAMCLWLPFTHLTAQEAPAMTTIPNAHQFEFHMMDDSKLKLESLKGKVVLIVNTASQCGLTPQYAQLQELYDHFKDDGLVIIGVPSDNFGGQEFAKEEEVKNFTQEKFEITFPLTVINDVKGSSAHPFYVWANKKAGLLGSPKWNFHKYLIDKNGNLAEWYTSTTKPTDEKVLKRIEEELAK